MVVVMMVDGMSQVSLVHTGKGGKVGGKGREGEEGDLS